MPSFLGERRFSITPETPLVFVHLFKAAGTSVHDYLSSVLPPDAFFPGRHIPEYEKIVPGYRVYSGHMLLRQWNDAPMKPHFVTWLRDPVARVVSSFYFLQGLPESYVAQSWNRAWIEDTRKLSFLEYVRSDEAHIRGTVRNGMSRVLCPTAEAEQSAWWRLAWTARAALRRFAYIGIAEQTDECLAHLARRFQLPAPSRDYRSNTYADNAKAWGTDAAAAQPATPEVIAAIKRYTKADRLLYRKALQMNARMT
jgi:hypothetical protein